MKQTNKITDQIQEKRKKCYIQARSFFLAAKRCGGEELCPESGTHQILPIPECVNIAFSCELYLKSLLYKDNKRIEGHGLAYLFSELDVTLRNRVSEISKIDEAEIKNLLEQHSNLFQNMRYRFEYKQYSKSYSMPIQFFYRLVESLDELAQEIIGVEPTPSTNADTYIHELFLDL